MLYFTIYSINIKRPNLRQMTDIKIVFVLASAIRGFKRLFSLNLLFFRHNHFFLITDIKICRKVMKIKEFTFALEAAKFWYK